MQPWPKPTAYMARDRLTIQTTWDRPSSAPLRWSKAESRRSSTWSPNRVSNVQRRYVMKKALLLVLTLTAMAAAQPAPAGNADNGKRLFERDGCYECHGHA